MSWKDAPIVQPAAGGWKDAPVVDSGRGALPELGRQVGLTARAGIQGLGGAVGLFTDPIGAIINQVLADGSPKAQTARSLASQLSDVLGLPKPENTLERIVGSAAESVAAAGGVAGGAQVLAPLMQGLPQATAQALASQPAQQLAGGAGAGIGAQSAQEAGVGPGGQLVAALAGGVAGARALPGARTPTQNPIIAEAERANIPIMTSDAIPPSTFMQKMVQAVGERIPYAGTGGKRAAQQEARIAAVRDLGDEFGAEAGLRLDEKIAADLLRKRGSDLEQYTRLKREAFAEAPGGPVNTPKAAAQIDAEIAALERLGPAVPPQALNALENFKQSIQGRTITELDDVRKLLGDTLSTPELASARSLTEKIPSRVYNELRSDIGEHIRQAGERPYAKWKVANTRLAELAGETRNTRLRAALNSGQDSPEAVSRLLFSAQPSDVRRLYANLSEQGKANARTAVLSRALDSATDGAGNISPDRFASQVEKMGSQVGVFFSPEQAASINGLARVIRATGRASVSAAAPPTGVQGVPFIGGAILTDMMGGAGAAVSSAIGLGALARAYESRPVRDALLRLGRSKVDSKEEAALLRRTISALQAAQPQED